MLYLNQQTGYYELPAGTEFYIKTARVQKHLCLGSLVTGVCIRKSLLSNVFYSEGLIAESSNNISWRDLSYIYRFLNLTAYGDRFRPLYSEQNKELYFTREGERAFYLEDHPLCYKLNKGQGVLW